MADFVSVEARSRIMRGVKGKENRTTELALVAELRRAGISGWRRHQPLPGRPDFSWTREKVALFVDGCFWHGCPRHYRAPTSNPKFWEDKIAGNRRRDRRVARELRAMGWSVYRIWECAVRLPGTVSRVRTALRRRR